MTLEWFLTLIMVIVGAVLLIKLVAWLTHSRGHHHGDTSGGASGSSADIGVTAAHKNDSDAGDSGSDGGGGD